MRIAICFSGQAERLLFDRDGNRTNHFESQLAKYQNCEQIDLFFNFWAINGLESSVMTQLSDILPKCMKSNFSVVCVQFIDPINPTEFSRARQEDCGIQNDRWSRYTNLNAMLSQFAGIKFVDQLRQKYECDHQFIYDLVFRARSDIEVLGEYNLPKFLQIIQSEQDVILLPSNQHHFNKWDQQGGMISDQWFGGSSATMSKITSLVDHIDEYISTGSRLHPESLVWWHISKNLHLQLAYQSFTHLIRGSNNDW